MLTYREFTALDLLDMSLPNLDKHTYSFTPDFYFRYLHGHAKYCLSVFSDSANIGYIIGNSGVYKDTKMLYSHVTALSIAQEFRRHGIGRRLLKLYEMNAKRDRSEFIDLFVKESNKVAIDFYMKCGYIIHKRIIDYYSNPTEDAFDMRQYTPEH
ncbi:N-terminal acetyltransferase B complex catalytic subunit [Nematocida ausubeli]|nr:N-terminal acetyltransferase B complex catalytic subunit [Nematocida ausubeli]